MWSRVVEVMLGCWLLMSPFLFAHGEGETLLWLTDFLSGSGMIVFALLSWWPTTRRAHVLSLAIAVWLIGFSWSTGLGAPSAANQNHMILGMLLLMFAVIPNAAGRPPASREETIVRSRRNDDAAA